jgi:hypothetical protein
MTTNTILLTREEKWGINPSSFWRLNPIFLMIESQEDLPLKLTASGVRAPGTYRRAAGSVNLISLQMKESGKVPGILFPDD